FSRKRRHTRFSRDWSSDVCSSDLTQDRVKMLEYIEQYKEERKPINAVGNIMKNRVYEELDVPAFTDRTRASLKIQEGCNNFCTFCIIPWARGLMRSRDPKEVIRQAQQLV